MDFQSDLADLVLRRLARLEETLGYIEQVVDAIQASLSDQDKEVATIAKEPAQMSVSRSQSHLTASKSGEVEPGTFRPPAAIEADRSS